MLSECGLGVTDRRPSASQADESTGRPAGLGHAVDREQVGTGQRLPAGREAAGFSRDRLSSTPTLPGNVLIFAK